MISRRSFGKLLAALPFAGVFARKAGARPVSIAAAHQHVTKVNSESWDASPWKACIEKPSGSREVTVSIPVYSHVENIHDNLNGTYTVTMAYSFGEGRLFDRRTFVYRPHSLAKFGA